MWRRAINTSRRRLRVRAASEAWQRPGPIPEHPARCPTPMPARAAQPYQAPVRGGGRDRRRLYPSAPEIDCEGAKAAPFRVPPSAYDAFAPSFVFSECVAFCFLQAGCGAVKTHSRGVPVHTGRGLAASASAWSGLPEQILQHFPSLLAAQASACEYPPERFDSPRPPRDPE